MNDFNAVADVWRKLTYFVTCNTGKHVSNSNLKQSANQMYTVCHLHIYCYINTMQLLHVSNLKHSS